MTRRESRELAFILLFEKTFTQRSVWDILQDAGEARDIEKDAFAVSLAEGTEARAADIDDVISRYSKNWNTNRLSRVALSLLRLAVYEMLFVEDIPVSVSINEAVELAKKYGGDDDPSFINGVLGGIARRNEEPTVQ